MVSNVLDADEDDLPKRLRTFNKKYADDPEYKKLRAALPKDWPL
jgi:predicted lipid carrier protein YhbT